MTNPVDELIIKIDADIKGAMAGIAKVESGIKGMGSSVERAAGGIRGATGKMVKAFTAVGVAASVGLAVTVGKATMAFADFEQAVTNAASVTGQSGAQYEATKENIEDLAKTLGETTVFSAQQAASAMYDLASAGYDVGTMTKTDLEPIMNLAAATQADLTFATETVTSALGQFGLGIEDSSRISDVFAKTIGSSKASIEKLALSMRYVGPVANSLGMDIEDVNAMLGQLYNAGFKGEQAGTALRAAMAKLMTPTAAVNGVLEELGIAYDDVNPATNDFADTLALLQNQGLDTNSAMKLFGVEAAPAMLALMANTDGIYELESALRDAGGAAEDMAVKQLDTLQGALTLLKSAFEGLMIAIGEMAAPAIKDFATKLTEMIPRVKELATAGIIKLKKVIEELSPTWDNLKAIFSASVGIIKDIFDIFSDGSGNTATLTDTINTLTTALAKVFKWIDEHPKITKLVVTLGLAAVAFAYVIPIVTTVIGVISSVGGAIAAASAFFAAGGTIVSALGVVMAALGGPITIIIGIVALLAAAWATNLFDIRGKTKAAIEFIIDKFNDVKNLITDAKSWGKDLIQAFIDGIISKVTDVGKAVKMIAGKVKDYIGFESPTKEGPGKDIMKWGPNMVQSFAEGINRSTPTINNAFSGLSTPAHGASPTGTSVFNIVIRDTVIREESDIDRLVSKIETKLAGKIRSVAV